jgi:hypothetical protein
MTVMGTPGIWRLGSYMLILIDSCKGEVTR